MKLLLMAMIGIIIVVISCNAQINYQPVPLPPGKYRLSEVTLVGVVANFDQLIRRSTLIIDGTVSKALGSQRINLDAPTSLETYSSVSVDKVIRGELPKGQTSIAIAEPGGNLLGYEVVITKHPLVKSGDRYILFLKPYERKGFVNNLQLPLYSIIGSWAGKAQVTEKGTIQFLPATALALHSFDGLDVEQFVAKLTERIKYLYPPRPILDLKELPGPPPPDRHYPVGRP
jgi:hypothetical protein